MFQLFQLYVLVVSLRITSYLSEGKAIPPPPPCTRSLLRPVALLQLALGRQKQQNIPHPCSIWKPYWPGFQLQLAEACSAAPSARADMELGTWRTERQPTDAGPAGRWALPGHLGDWKQVGSYSLKSRRKAPKAMHLPQIMGIGSF